MAERESFLSPWERQKLEVLVPQYNAELYALQNGESSDQEDLALVRENLSMTEAMHIQERDAVRAAQKIVAKKTIFSTIVQIGKTIKKYTIDNYAVDYGLPLVVIPLAGGAIGAIGSTILAVFLIPSAVGLLAIGGGIGGLALAGYGTWKLIWPAFIKSFKHHD